MKLHLFSAAFFALGVVTLATAAISAADPIPAPNRIGVQSTVPNPVANQVLLDLHRINAMEIDMGKLANSKSTDQTIRDYAQKLIGDHETAQKKVTDLASDRNLSFAENIDTSSGESATTFKNNSMAHLNDLKGREFDRAYLKHMIDDHTKAAKMLRGAEPKLSDTPDVKKLVTELIPVIEQHLSEANDLLKQVSKSKQSS